MLAIRPKYGMVSTLEDVVWEFLLTESSTLRCECEHHPACIPSISLERGDAFSSMSAYYSKQNLILSLDPDINEPVSLGMDNGYSGGSKC